MPSPNMSLLPLRSVIILTSLWQELPFSHQEVVWSRISEPGIPNICLWEPLTYSSSGKG